MGRYQEEFAIRNPGVSWFRRLALPLLLGLGLAGAWSAFWVFTRAQIEREIDHEVAQVEARGGEFLCEDRQWRGFPLRIAMTCGRTLLALPGGAAIETASLEAAGYVHDLRRIAVLAEGPSRVELATDQTLALDHSPARIALVASAGGGASQVSLEAEQLGVASDAGWSLRGRNVSASLREEAAERLAFSASGDDLSLAGPDLATTGLERLAIEGRVDDPPRSLTGNVMALLREAAQRGSRVTVERFTMEMAGIVISAAGTVELAPEGPTGTLATTVSNYRDFLADLERRGVVSRRAVRASTAVIGLLQGGRREGGEVRIALRFHEGKVFWGPFLIAEIPPLQ